MKEKLDGEIILYIDSADSNQRIAIFNASGVIKEKYLSSGDLSEKLLLEIEKMFITLGISKNKIAKVVVNNGPGSYTGLRIGVTTANFLACSLGAEIYSGKLKNGKLSILEKAKDHYILPKYFQQAQITKSKKVEPQSIDS